MNGDREHNHHWQLRPSLGMTVNPRTRQDSGGQPVSLGVSDFIEGGGYKELFFHLMLDKAPFDRALFLK